MSALFSLLGRAFQVVDKGMIPFAKVEALGNDFVWILPRVLLHGDGQIAPWIVSLADRTRGVGCDGIILWSSKDGAETPLFFFNRDGSPAEACGNGLRAVGVAGRELGFMEPGRAWFRIFDHAFPVDIPSTGQRAGAGLRPPGHYDERVVERDVLQCLERKELVGGFVRIPNPHVVILTSSRLNRSAKNTLIRDFRDIVEGGTNIGFAVIRESREIGLEVFERGVGWTLACGTGAAAAFVVAERLGLVEGTIHVRQPGGCLEVSGDSDGRVWIRGTARLVFVGWWPVGDLDGSSAGVEFLN